MRELDKIQEAEHFYSQMVKEKENKDSFKFNLSAFLSSARSVLQYALKEVLTKDGGKEWYFFQIYKNKIVKYLGNKRNINIHKEPVSFRRGYVIHTSETIYIGDSVSMVVKDRDGNIKSESHTKLQPVKSAIDRGLIESKYSFDDWPGSEDIFLICQEYLKELREIIKDGRKRRFLT